MDFHEGTDFSYGYFLYLSADNRSIRHTFNNWVSIINKLQAFMTLGFSSILVYKIHPSWWDQHFCKYWFTGNFVLQPVAWFVATKLIDVGISRSVRVVSTLWWPLLAYSTSNCLTIHVIQVVMYLVWTSLWSRLISLTDRCLPQLVINWNASKHYCNTSTFGSVGRTLNKHLTQTLLRVFPLHSHNNGTESAV